MSFDLIINKVEAGVNKSTGDIEQVIRVHWSATKTAADIEAKITGAFTDIPPEYPPAQKLYSDVTIADADAWVRDLHPEFAIESELDAELSITLVPSVTSGQPWVLSFPLWAVGISVSVGDIRMFEYNPQFILDIESGGTPPPAPQGMYPNYAWECVQAHTTQVDWTPPLVPALWRIWYDPALGPRMWVQPTGAQDAYNIGELVYWDNPNDNSNLWVYESAIAANTTEPGRDGTFDRWWTPVELYVP